MKIHIVVDLSKAELTHNESIYIERELVINSLSTVDQIIKDSKRKPFEYGVSSEFRND